MCLHPQAKFCLQQTSPLWSEAWHLLGVQQVCFHCDVRERSRKGKKTVRLQVSVPTWDWDHSPDVLQHSLTLISVQLHLNHMSKCIGCKWFCAFLQGEEYYSCMWICKHRKKTLDVAWELITLELSQHAEKLICVADLQVNDCLELQQESELSPWKHTCMNKWTGKSLLNVFQKLLTTLLETKKEKNHMSLK